ncbi:hypothetical protein Cantr_00345 [Candida viswanathii]|uniref:Uncharacterized protein n=1 Tax=Candida viswanathii TaxID=5486 RepID=A0A367YGK4_9ASCO|nr:hypothetical protein Cantr_00345 [Candida viswanathii]
MDIDNNQDISSPPTPIHPAPNEELADAIPAGVVLSDANIDLNPDLYDEDDEIATTVEDTHLAEHAKLPYIQQLQHPQDASGSATETDLEDVDINQLQQITLPFNESYQLLKLSFGNTTPTNGGISSGQQSKFINYLDENLLQIQRRYIRQKTESVVTYSLIDLLEDISNIVNLIWVSIEQKQVLYGQIEYYIKILGDLEDYVSNYSHIFNESWSRNGHLQIDMQNLVVFFKFWQKLDLQLSFLIDGYTINVNGSPKLIKMNTTEITRLLPIVSRLRILIISKIDMIRSKLKAGDHDSVLNIFEVEISRIFEGVLERS